MKTFESGFSMAGSAVSQMVVEVTNAGSAGNLYICTAYQQIMTLDAMGNLQMIR
jgi:glucose dehydrogenase